MSLAYPSVTIAGGILTHALVQRLGEGDQSLPHSKSESYGFGANEPLRRLASRSYTYLLETWRDFTKLRARLNGDPSDKQTFERWTQILLRELGYHPLTEKLIIVDDQSVPISHTWGDIAVHLVGWGRDLDRRIDGVTGPAGQAPHSVVQSLLNRSEDHLWAVLSNGRRLRVLRDSTSLVGTAYIEFDLEAIFDGELFADFVLLFRLVHATRLEVRDREAGPASCVLERWRSVGIQEGERALELLREGVRRAIEILGTGFLSHPANAALRAGLERREWTEADLQRSLLRLVYRLLFWFVVEDRDLLLDPGCDPVAQRRYEGFFSSRRLRELAIARKHSHHGDLWRQVQLVFAGLGDIDGVGLPQLGLPALGGLFITTRHADPERGEKPGTRVTLPLDRPLEGTELSNTALLQAVEALAVLPGVTNGRRRRVDFRHLDAEEFGGVYEDLLALQPRVDLTTRRYELETLRGNERKTTGSYYTPSSLVECLLDSALDPLIEEALDHGTPQERVEALLKITVCDPACGSGHFLIAAARRIAKAIAVEETRDDEPPLPVLREATRRVIARCIYGVDVNEMAVELCKVSLWLEAMDPGKALGYLDANIRVGNSLLGVTPALLEAGIPDDAYVALEGDDKQVVAALKRQNAQERAGQTDLFDRAGLHLGNRDLAEATTQILSTEVRSLADVHVQEQRAAALDGARRMARLVADAWCAVFVQLRTEETRPVAITHSTLDILSGPDLMGVAPIVETVRDVAARYRFFHWHLEFPHIFRVPDHGLGAEPAGWDGGFSLVIGNPPWERVKLQEQEFFASRDESIAKAPNAAKRKAAIQALAASPEPAKQALYQEWLAALRFSDGVSHLVRDSGRYPLTATGDINTYSVFAETGRMILSPRGQLGMVIPTGIATDATTQKFFRDLVVARSLVSLYDFENEDKIFPEVHNQYRFCLLTVSGRARPASTVSLVFRVRQADQIQARAYTLKPEEITLLNPNTGTCPVFRSRRDAEITIGIYQRVPILWRDGDRAGNPWDLSFMAMYHMANDSGLFQTEEALLAEGWRRDGNVYVRDGERMLPLYEAKMVHHFDHRFATYAGATEAQLNKGTLPRLEDADHDDPARVPMPRYWVAERVDSSGGSEQPETLFGEPARDRSLGVDARLGRWRHGWLLGWRDVARSVDERTLIASVIPRVAVGDKFLLAFVPGKAACLQANLSALVTDYVVRQKLSGPALKYFVIKQVAVLPPTAYDAVPPWDREAGSLEAWVTARVLELTYTSYDIAAYARDLGDEGEPFRWDAQRRSLMRAELDAAYFHLYGVTRDDVDHILGTFPLVSEHYKGLVSEIYDEMATATRKGKPYATRLDPPPAHGPRHPPRKTARGHA